MKNEMPEMRHDEGEGAEGGEKQMEFDFDRPGGVIKGAKCYDDSRPRTHEIVVRDLTSIGDGRYVDDKGWIYERSVVNHEKDGPWPRFVRMNERYERQPDSDFFAD